MAAVETSRSETREQLDSALARRKTMSHLRLGDALVQEKVITEAQRDAALAAQSGDRRKLLGEILVESGAVTREAVRRVLAEQLGVPWVNVATFPCESSAVEAISGGLARKHMALPLYRTQARIAVCIENPLSWEALQELERFTGLKVDPVMAAHEDLIEAIAKAYGQVAVVEALPRAEEVIPSDNALLRMANTMMADACDQGTFSIHIESMPGDRQNRVRFRVDGVLGPHPRTTVLRDASNESLPDTALHGGSR